MSDARDLVETIKIKFARRATDQLRDVAEGGDRWSPEATLAAREVLQDRLDGFAQEPSVPEVDLPPDRSYGHAEIALTLGGFLLGGVLGAYLVNTLVSPYRKSDKPDFPQPFGRKMAWFALLTTDTVAAGRAMDLRDTERSRWGDGIEAAHNGSVFITPPVGEWTLALGTPLFQLPDAMGQAIESRLVALSRHFGDAQYFCNHADLGLFVWGRAIHGKLVRGYGWLGSLNRTVWDVGKTTSQERDLGFRFAEGVAPTIDPGDKRDPVPFTEDDVLNIACHWSIDPTTLDDLYYEPVTGLLGTIPRERRTNPSTAGPALR